MHDEAVLKTESFVASKSRIFPYLICLLGSMFYLYEFALQVSPGAMTNDLMRDFQINAAGLGAMTAFYYYAYTPMQLPAGLLYDRFGPRVLLSIAIGVCAFGAFLFSLTHSVALASASRFLIGMCSAFSFTGALLLISRWLPSQQFALMAGIVQFMSSIGAILGQVPVAGAIGQYGWRHVFLVVAMLGSLLALFVYLFVRDCPNENNVQKAPAKVSEWQRLMQVCGNTQVWLIALYSFLIWAPIVAFAVLWGIPFLATAYAISTKAASAACAMIWLGIGIGSPLIGWWSQWVGRRCTPLTFVAFVGFAAVGLVIYGPHFSYSTLYILLFLIGVASAGQSLAFGVVKDRSQCHLVGTAIGFNNMAVVAGGAFFPPLVGILLHLHSSGTILNGVPQYNLSDYRVALFLVPLCYLFAAMVSKFLIKETFCKQQYED